HLPVSLTRGSRVLGRGAMVVRAIHLPQWWNLKMPVAIKAKTDVPPQSVGPGGVADASLYARLSRAGLADLVAFPALVTLDDPDGPIWRYREDHVLSQLTPAETEVWHAARAAALAQGPLLQDPPRRFAVGRKPWVGLRPRGARAHADCLFVALKTRGHAACAALRRLCPPYKLQTYFANAGSAAAFRAFAPNAGITSLPNRSSCSSATFSGTPTDKLTEM